MGMANQDLETTNSSAFYSYQLHEWILPVTPVGYNYPPYSNNLLQYCSAQDISMLEYLSYPVEQDFVAQVIIFPLGRLTIRIISLAMTLRTPIMSFRCSSHTWTGFL